MSEIAMQMMYALRSADDKSWLGRDGMPTDSLSDAMLLWKPSFRVTYKGEKIIKIRAILEAVGEYT